VVDESADFSQRAGTSNYLRKVRLEPEHQRSLEMGRIGGRGSSIETAIRRLNLSVTVKWECRYIPLFKWTTH
jgi:hypothetical protein